MSYIGVEPKSGFIKADQEKITGQTTNYVNLTNSISSLDDVQIWVNYVIQDPSTLTLNSSTQVGLGDTLVSSDVVLVTYLGQSVATQNPANNSVTNDMLAGSITAGKLSSTAVDNTNTNSTLITAQTEKSSLVDADKFLISDSAASGALKYVQKSNLNSGTLVLLDDTYISSSTASITYSSSLITDTYEQYIITGSAIQVASAGGGNILLHVSADNGSSYYTGGTDYSRSVYVGESSLTANTVISRSGDAGAVEVTGNAYDFGSGAYGNCGFVVRCFNLKNLATGSGARRLFELFSVYVNKDSTSNFVCNQGMAFFKGGTGEINNIKLSLSHSNTFGEGEFRLYGVA